MDESRHPDFTLSRWKQVVSCMDKHGRFADKRKVKTDSFFGRYFGFHYQSSIRNLLRMALIAKESVHKTYEGCEKEPKFKTISVS